MRKNVTLRTTIVLASVLASVFTMTEVEAQIPGLIHCYPGDVDASDTVGTNPGIFENGATAGTPGKVGGAFLFDGIDDGVNLGNVPDLDYGPSSSFTWEAWVNSSGSSAQPVMFIITANYQCSFSSQVLAILGSFFGPDEGRIYSRVCDETSCVELLSPSPICFNVWNHIVYVREVLPSGKLLKIYLNCALVAIIQDTTTGSLTTNGDDFIGRRFICPTTSNFNGLIDEVRFYNRALTDAEVCLTYIAGGGGGGCPGTDTDGDGLLDSTEVEMAMGSGCPSPLDADSDNDSLPDGAEVDAGTNPCSADADGDGIADDFDNCPGIPNSNQADLDADNIGDACDSDNDNDGVLDGVDNCPVVANSNQTDFDGDGIGDACESDDDNDGVLDGVDGCPGTLAGEVVNADGCTIAALCPCENSWKSHGDYVSCVVRTAGTFVAAGLITEAQKGAIVSEAAQSNCGSK